MAKVSLNDLRTRASTVDHAKLDATTDAQIEAYKAEDGYADLAVPEAARVVEPPQAIRVRLGMTQKEISAALNIPLGTWRNWEQGRVNLEPAALALLAIVSRAPDVAFAAQSAKYEPEAIAFGGEAKPNSNAPDELWAAFENNLEARPHQNWLSVVGKSPDFYLHPGPQYVVSPERVRIPMLGALLKSKRYHGDF